MFWAKGRGMFSLCRSLGGHNTKPVVNVISQGYYEGIKQRVENIDGFLQYGMVTTGSMRFSHWGFVFYYGGNCYVGCLTHNPAEGCDIVMRDGDQFLTIKKLDFIPKIESLDLDNVNNLNKNEEMYLKVVNILYKYVDSGEYKDVYGVDILSK